MLSFERKGEGLGEFMSIWMTVSGVCVDRNSSHVQVP